MRKMYKYLLIFIGLMPCLTACVRAINMCRNENASYAQVNVSYFSHCFEMSLLADVNDDAFMCYYNNPVYDMLAPTYMKIQEVLEYSQSPWEDAWFLRPIAWFVWVQLVGLLPLILIVPTEWCYDFLKKKEKR